MNHLPQHYGSERLIAALIELDWSTAASGAIKAIQATVREWFGEWVDAEDAVWILASLRDRRLIRTEIHPDEVFIGSLGSGFAGLIHPDSKPPVFLNGFVQQTISAQIACDHVAALGPVPHSR